VDDLLPTLHAATAARPRTLLELGSGGGSVAYHLKQHFAMTLSDRSSAMLEVSRTMNPECEHLLGDMRHLEIGRQFDLVLIHDAIAYMTDDASLRAAFRTAYRHCRPGGAAVILPDHVTETFSPYTEHGGEDDASGRGLRYLEWTFDPDSADTLCESIFAFVLREGDGEVTTMSDRHLYGLFPYAAWHDWLSAAGFDVSSRLDPWHRHVFVARKPA
jgi:ubiquinone/menaquinone biosynthesis C-methylase UbiE